MRQRDFTIILFPISRGLKKLRKSSNITGWNERSVDLASQKMYSKMHSPDFLPLAYLAFYKVKYARSIPFFCTLTIRNSKIVQTRIYRKKSIEVIFSDFVRKLCIFAWLARNGFVEIMTSAKDRSAR